MWDRPQLFLKADVYILKYNQTAQSHGWGSNGWKARGHLTSAAFWTQNPERPTFPPLRPCPGGREGKAGSQVWGAVEGLGGQEGGDTVLQLCSICGIKPSPVVIREGGLWERVNVSTGVQIRECWR